MKKYLISIVVLLAAVGCGGARSSGELRQEGSSDFGDPVAILHAAEDQRSLDPGLTYLAGHNDVEIRRRVALAVGRIGSAEGARILEGLLDDPDPDVRDEAAFASGLLGARAPAELKAALLSRIDDEQRPEGIWAILDAIGRIGEAATAALLIGWIENPNPQVRAAAARSLGFYGQRGLPVPDDIVIQLAAGLTDEAEPVRFMSAFALYRIAEPLPGPAGALAALQKSATEDESPEVRAYALRALARRGGLTREMIDHALSDTDARVGATAASVIGFAGEGARCGLAIHTLGAVATRMETESNLVGGAFTHTARAALERAIECRSEAKIRTAAGRIAAKVDVGGEPGSAGAARVLCLARVLAGADDLAIVSCDPGRAHVGKKTLILRLNRGADMTDADLVTLLEMTADADHRVAIAALGALTEIPRPEARQRLLDALTDDRELVVAAALDAIAASPDGFRNADEGTGPKATEAVIEAVDNVVDRFAPFDHVYAPLISGLYMLKALGDPAAEPVLRRLAADPRPPIRHMVLDVYRGIEGIDAPSGLPKLTPTRAVSVEEVDTWREADVTARVRTTQGAFTIALHSDVAPATVGSFAKLAEAGYFDDTEIHRVVPNFVVQAGDPTGTGLGDPGYSLRCEASSLPYRRGTVGMALSGKDTGGSQFFVALSRQPHLDGNYTVFGEVTAGMEVVDLIEEGDQILGVSIDRE